jgi:hypothetical protein
MSQVQVLLYVGCTEFMMGVQNLCWVYRMYVGCTAYINTCTVLHKQ